MVFVSGMLGIDPRSGNLVAGGVEHEARQALRNLAAVLEAAGSSVDKVPRSPPARCPPHAAALRVTQGRP